MQNIIIATDEATIRACYPIMKQLRPQYSEEQFIERVKRKIAQDGYHLAALKHENNIVACAGFRYGEFLAWGKILYVDDLITDEQRRSQNFGEALFDWLVEQAKQQHCAQLHLDSGVQRFGAHKFYLRKNMKISAHHFSLEL